MRLMFVTTSAVKLRLLPTGRLLLVGACALLAACVGRNAPPPPEAEPRYPSARIYGLLVEQEGGYRFTRFSLSNRDRHRNDEAWVDFKTLQPAFTTADQECSKGLLDLMAPEENEIPDRTRPLCDTEGPLFREADIDAGDIAKNTLGNLVTQVTGIGVSGYFTTHFDGAAYRSALKQASREFNFARFTAQTRALLGEYRQALTRDRQASDQLQSQLQKGIRLMIEDDSGSFPLSTAALHAQVKVEIQQPPPEPMPELFFTDLAHLQRQFTRLLDDDRRYTEVRLVCPAQPGFNLTITGCEKAYDYEDFADARNAEAPVITYRVHAKQGIRFVPPFPPFGNEVLQIQGLSDGRLQVRNLGTHALVFESVSLSLNGDIATQFILNQRLEPAATGNLPNLQSFDTFDEYMAFEEVDADTLAVRVQYGLEVTYTDSGSGIKNQVGKRFNAPYGEFTQHPH